MTQTMTDIRHPAWHPIASSEDLPFRHVYHGQLLGQEFAVWRADDGNVNVWENRCLHRGVRLSIGLNEGAELKGTNHGWRYAMRSPGCSYIPAHPADAPARRITNRTFPAVESLGLVWSAMGDVAPFAPPLPEGNWLPLRPLPVNARPGAVLAALSAAREAESDVESLPPLGARLVLSGVDGRTAAFFVQPVDSGRAVIRGVVEAESWDDQLSLLRLFNERLSALRRQVEAETALEEQPEPLVPVYEPVSLELATMPDLRFGRQAKLRVRVARKWQAGADVTGLELAALEGHLPTFQPGAHLDLFLPNGLIRQYSITNGPGELLSYTVGVKREPDSRGGSVAIADELREGDVVAISEPRNNFPLRRDATRTILIAGGIGITPLLAMAKTLASSRLPFELHVFARSPQHVAFPEALDKLGESVVSHIGLDPAGTAAEIEQLVSGYGFARHLYVCGPGPMLDLVRRRAAEAGWPEEAVHFEYFKNVNEIDLSSTFTVELARSALTLTIPSGKSILEVMRENGVDAPSSCEQGACGTCLTTVLEGIPDHQDVYLNDTERRSNTCMMTCVSRAKSDRLVLDI